jgi:hypothetical protein
MKRPFSILGCLVALATIVTAKGARADKEIGLGVSYDPRLPVGSLRTLVPDVALAGVQGQWEYYVVADKLAAGFQFQYHYFQGGRGVTTVQIDNGAATAPFTRYAYFLTFLPTVRWLPAGRSSRTVRPYVELGAGATSATSALLASDLSRNRNEGGFVLEPSAGVLWAIASREIGAPTSSGAAEEGAPPLPNRRRETMLGVQTSVAWAFTTADVVAARNVSYLGVQVGLYSKL